MHEIKRAIFDKAIQIESAKERARFLDEACKSVVQVRSEVEKLISDHFQAGEFMEDPIPVPAIEPNDTTTSGQIGPYRIREQIGEGGFGTVYVAQQKQPIHRKVALKVVKPGMDSANIIARFESERQALAMMDHPNIAKVFDGGTTESGRPYFVMELVHGMPLTDFANDQKLSTGERLRLFVDVCRAVQHAHQKGVIHRDLKPSNIMVTMHDDIPVPKVIDFGISKALSHKLTEKSIYTAYGQMIGTPMYMSPEQTQLSGLDVDTRSDIYSLGVLLYELLTGTTPFDGETFKNVEFDELRRMIREDDPPRPSVRISTMGAQTLTTISKRRGVDGRQLSQIFRGELDWIVMKALEKDRTRRYETAERFAADVQRFLNDEAVEACPPSVTYRLGKFVRRNRSMVITTSLVLVTLMLGILGTAWQANLANRQRVLAERAKDTEINLRRQAEKRLATSYLVHAQTLCEDGEIGRGMLWFARGLRIVPEGAADLNKVIRANLAAWRPRLHSLQMLVEHQGPVVGMVLSQDGQRLLSGDKFGNIGLSDTASGKPIGNGVKHERLTALAFSPNGLCASASQDGTVRLWNGNTLQAIGKPLQHQGPVHQMVFSSDGSQIATASSGVNGFWESGIVSRWDVETCELIDEPFQRKSADDQFPNHAIRTMAFTDLGLQAVVTISPGTHQIWNIELGKSSMPLISNPNTRAITISRDGLRLATAGEGRISIWDVPTGTLTAKPVTHVGVRAVAFSGDGSLLVSGGNDRSARIWRTNDGQPVGGPMRQAGAVTFVGFGPDDRHVTTASENGTARLWSVAFDETVGHPIHHQDGIEGAAYGPNGLCILIKSENAYHLRDAATGRTIGNPLLIDKGEAGQMMALHASDGYRMVSSHQGNLRLWDVDSGQLIGQLGKGRIGIPRVAEFSPDGSRILVGYQSQRGAGHAQLWDAQTAEPIGHPLPHDKTVIDVAFSPDGARLITGSFDATSRQWNGITLQPIGQPLLHQSGIESLAISPDGSKLVTGFSDGTARLWSAGSPSPIGSPIHHNSIVRGVTFNLESSQFMTCSADHSARIWDVATQETIGPPLYHQCRYPRVSFHPNGQEIMITDGQTVQTWRSAPPPIEGESEQIILWTQIMTGLELDPSGGISVLAGPRWKEHFQRSEMKTTVGSAVPN